MTDLFLFSYQPLWVFLSSLAFAIMAIGAKALTRPRCTMWEFGYRWSLVLYSVLRWLPPDMFRKGA